ncbi:uncharacterized protein [Rhodnius prolixus]|uniref:Ashwin n=2 Tax=Rhodnius prolixus TaxID=13249 RepID=T1IF57_RHOPR
MEEKSESSASRCFKLLQPELMTIEELCEILRACCVKNDLTSYNKSELIELFKRVALPLPQREYSNNSWRERLLSKGQKRKVASTEERDNVKRLCATNGSTKFLPNNSNITVQTNKSTSSSRTPNTSRLKPPINIDNYTKKVLKLALPNSKNSDGSSSRKMIMKEKTEIKSQEKIINLPSKKIVLKGEGNEITSEERISKSTVKLSSEEKLTLSNGKHKRIVIDFSDSSTTTTKTPKLVNLKRSNSEITNSGKKVRRIVDI